MTDSASHRGDDIAAFVADLARQEVAVRTLKSYGADLRLFAAWLTGTTGDVFAAAAVTPTDVRDYRAHLISVERRQPATVNRKLAALRRFFLWAKGSRLIGELPSEGVKLVASAPRSPKSLPKREVDRLIRQVEKSGSKRDLAIVLTLRHSGVRVGELCALTLHDVELSERKGQLTVRWGKGNKFRVIPLNVDARNALTAYLGVRPRVADEHLFINQRGGPLTSQGVQDLVGKYARQAGLDDVTPHTLRHTFGKGLLDAGVDLVTVAALLGHERLEMTAIYTQPSARELEQAVGRLERDASGE